MAAAYPIIIIGNKTPEGDSEGGEREREKF